MRQFGPLPLSIPIACSLFFLGFLGNVQGMEHKCQHPAHTVSGFHGLSHLSHNSGESSSLNWGKWNRNKSHINWEFAETEHFRFYYAKDLQDVAEYIAGLSERVYEQKAKRYQIELPSKVEFVIREDIFSNGWANAYQNTMQVWVADWGIPMRSTHHWLHDVVTHELAHIISIQSGSKLPSSIFGLVVGYQDYYNEPTQTSFSTVIPFTSQPNWFAEGVAQYESELSGYDAWDAHRDMILRVAVLEDSLLDYGRMGVFAGKGLHYEQGPYTQGFAFVRYLAERYGDSFVLDLWKENARIHRQTLSGAMKRKIGKSGPELWKEWESVLHTQYGEQVESLGPIKEGVKYTEGSFFNHYPRWSPNGETIYFISNKGRKSFKGQLYAYSLADSLEGKKDEERLKVLSSSVRGYFDVLPNDSTFLFASGIEKNKNGDATLDLYSKNLKKKNNKWWDIAKWFSQEKGALTKDVNAIYPHVNSKGDELVFVAYEGTNFYLATMNVDLESEQVYSDPLQKEEVEFLFPQEESIEGQYGFNVYTPKFSPNGQKILFSYFDGNSRKIGLINRDGSDFKAILNRPYADRDPEWLPDGKSFLYVSDSSGIYNIYRYFLEDQKEYSAKHSYPITNVLGGAFAPSVHPDGQQVAYIQYDKDGFSLYHIQNMDNLAGEGSSFASYAPLGEGTDVFRKGMDERTAVIEPTSLNARPYRGIPSRGIIQPLFIGREALGLDKSARTGETKWMAGVSTFWNDPVGENQVALSFLAEIGKGWDYIDFSRGFLNSNKETELYASWWNHSLPISLGLEYIRRNITTLDTATSNNDQGRIDTVETRQAITLQNIQASMKYSLFPKGSSFLALVGGISNTGTDLYDIPFQFDFYNNKYLSPTFFYRNLNPESKVHTAPQGLAIFANYSWNWTQLLRAGNSFRETFVFENGVLKEQFRDFQIQQFRSGVDYAMALPWSSQSSVRFSGNVNSIIHWKQSGSAVDSLDPFLSLGMGLRGYPYLQDRENVLFRGENTVALSVDYNQTLWSDLYKRYWIFFLEDIYGHLFWETGRAWNGKLAQVDLWNKDSWTGQGRSDKWHQSIGWGLKLSSRIYHNFPLNVYLESSTALNSIASSTQEGESQKLSTIEIFGVSTFATQIRVGASLGFYNGLLSGSPDVRHTRGSVLRFR
jgi:Tol biopolymer transport system component